MPIPLVGRLGAAELAFVVGLVPVVMLVPTYRKFYWVAWAITKRILLTHALALLVLLWIEFY